MRLRYSPQTLLFVFALLISLVPLVGCGIATEGNDSERAQNQRDNDRLEKAYAGVVGIYRGNLVVLNPAAQAPGGGSQAPHLQANMAQGSVQLSGQVQIYIEYINDGYDRTGSPRTHPQLTAQLKLDSIGELDDTTFIVDYGQYDGRVKLRQPATSSGTPGSGSPGSGGTGTGAGSIRACAVGPRDPELSITGVALNGKLDGTVNGSSGTLGPINMVRVSSSATQPLRDQEIRLRRAFANVVGRWHGPTNITTATTQPVNTEGAIYITVDDQAAGPSVTCPVLTGQFRLANVVGKIDDTYLTVDYRQGTGEIFFTYKESPNVGRVCPIGPTDKNLALNTRLDIRDLKNPKLTGIITGQGGQIGNINLAYSPVEKTAPDDQIQRLNAAYNPVQGVYAGKYNGSGPEHTFPVEFNLYIVQNQINPFLACPALKGNYIRPDLTQGAGSQVLDLEFLPVEGNLVMTSTTQQVPGGSTGLPGHNNMAVHSHFTGNHFEGPMSWWQYAGTVSATKCPGANPAVDQLGRCVRRR